MNTIMNPSMYPAMNPSMYPAMNPSMYPATNASMYPWTPIPLSTGGFNPPLNHQMNTGQALAVTPHPPISEMRTYVDPFMNENRDEILRKVISEIDPSCVEKSDLIGEGFFGNVYLGLMKISGIPPRQVAVKIPKTYASGKEQEDFLAEASIMGQFDDPNVIQLLGVVTKTKPNMIITEFMENGSLDKFLRGNYGRFTTTQLLKMMRDIASGMLYLSKMNYVHRDLAARNILVNEYFVCKVADFGLSRCKDVNGAYESKGGKFPIAWTAPEAIVDKLFTSASDVWSFGIVVWEIMTYGKMPYENLSNEAIIEAIWKGFLLPTPVDCPEDIRNLMMACWRWGTGDRPPFSTIVAGLDLIMPFHALSSIKEFGSMIMMQH